MGEEKTSNFYVKLGECLGELGDLAKSEEEIFVLNRLADTAMSAPKEFEE